MNEKEAKKIKKQIEKLENVLNRLKIRSCKGYNERKQKEIEIVDFKNRLHSLKNERDGTSMVYQKRHTDNTYNPLDFMQEVLKEAVNEYSKRLNK